MPVQSCICGICKTAKKSSGTVCWNVDLFDLFPIQMSFRG